MTNKTAIMTDELQGEVQGLIYTALHYLNIVWTVMTEDWFLSQQWHSGLRTALHAAYDAIRRRKLAGALDAVRQAKASTTRRFRPCLTRAERELEQCIKLCG